MCLIRPYEQEDRDGIIQVVRPVHEEYGFAWDADGYHRDLYDVNRYYLAAGGMFWSALDGGRIVGCAGVTLHGPTAELHRLYLLPSHRGRGLGRRLLETTTQYARRHGCRRMVAWSDVLLAGAHRLYGRCGFIQRGRRVCDDPDRALEHAFWKEPL